MTWKIRNFGAPISSTDARKSAVLDVSTKFKVLLSLFHLSIYICIIPLIGQCIDVPVSCKSNGDTSLGEWLDGDLIFE